MPDLLLYLLKANIALVLFCLAYYFILRRLTFYSLNRAFLLFSLLFSYLYPFLDLSGFFEQHQPLAIVNSYAVALPAAWQVTPMATPQAQAFDYWLIPVNLFMLGAAVVAIRLLLQFISLYKIHAQSEPAAYKSIGYRRVQSIRHAFSFWRAIYLNPEQHKPQQLDSILKHELVHVKGWHTLDVLLTEFCTLLCWFNPGGWLMKKAVKENLEFIADQNVLNAGVDRKDYQYLLLNITGVSEPQIANQFNFSPLKTRIAMMNKIPSARANQLKLLVVLPLVAVLLVAFSSTSKSSGLIANAEKIATKVTRQSGEKDLPKELKEYLERHPAIKNARMKVINNRNSLVVHLRKGGTEVYYLDDANSIAALENKYGKLPELPPPPPPVPAAPDEEGLPTPPPPVPQDQSEPFIFLLDEVDYYKNEANWPADYKEFLKRNPNVKKAGWKFSDRKDWNLESFVVYLKSGKTEVYDYNKNPRIPAAEAKYGTLPQLPPPPPPVRAEEKLPPPPPPVKHEEAKSRASLPEGLVYFIDGKEDKTEKYKSLDPKEVHSINVYKGDNVEKILGKSAAKGVVSIITKENRDSPQVKEFMQKLPALPTPPPPAAN